MKQINISVNVADSTWEAHKSELERLESLTTTELGLLAVKSAIKCKIAKDILTQRGIQTQLDVQVQILQQQNAMYQDATVAQGCSVTNNPATSHSDTMQRCDVASSFLEAIATSLITYGD